ncbi:hypothetical protein C0995_000189 [Termitomyces sp. Mi166|nr:hypothetical protein C0995_000189 [Termitomyces sp. Mi166\
MRDKSEPHLAKEIFGHLTSAIFFAKSTIGLPGFTNLGSNQAIDPNLYTEGSNWYLTLGSFWTGIKLMTLSSSTGKPTSTSVTPLAQRTVNNGAIEASVIYKYGGYYYLFSSWESAARALQARTTSGLGGPQGTIGALRNDRQFFSSVSGPYIDASGVALINGGGTLVLQTHDALGINLLDFTTGWPRDAEMGFFSSKKADDWENYPSNDKSVASVIRSRFYGKNKGKERDGHPAPSFTTKDLPAAQILSNSTLPSPARAPNWQPSPLSPNSNGARTAGPSILRVQTDKMLATPGSAPKTTQKPSNMGTPSPSSSSSPEALPASGPHHQSSKDASSPLRQPSNNVTMTLAQRLNELAVANSQGLLNDDEYRLLRQNLFERFATSTTVPTEAPVVPVSRPLSRRTIFSQQSKPRPLSNFQVEVNRSPSVRSKISMTSGVTSFLRRAASRRTPAGSNDFSDASSTFSAVSVTSNILTRGPSKKSSAASVRTTTSRNQVDNISISSRTGLGLQAEHSSHPPISISHSNASVRRLATPPSSFPSRLPGETYRTSAFNADMLDDEHLQTTTEIRQEISTIEAEVRRLMDAFNGLEMTTLAKLQRHQGRNTLVETTMSMSAPTTPRRVLIADSDMTSLRSATSVSSIAKSAHSPARFKGGIVSAGLPNSARSGSLRRKDSLSSVGAEERKTEVPPVPASSGSYGRLGVGSASNVSLARSHVTMSAVPEDEPPLPQPRTEEGKFEDEMDDIQRRRAGVSERYAARLEYLRAKLKGAQLREKLARK